MLLGGKMDIGTKSYINPKVEIRVSRIHGYGMFAKETILAGEIVYVKGGHILNRNQLVSSNTINSYLPISDNLYVGALTLEEEENIKLYNNHSCNPNCGLHGEVSFIAINEIKKDEELTVDYAFIDNENYSFRCNCGYSSCRKVVTGYDWKIKSIQDKYYPYFAQYLKDKM